MVDGTAAVAPLRKAPTTLATIAVGTEKAYHADLDRLPA